MAVRRIRRPGGRTSAAPKPVRAQTGARARADVAAKRTLDVVVALALLAALTPLLAVLAIAIKLESRGPVFHRCRRVGHRGAELAMVKFRKMVRDAAGPPLTLADDARLTRLGRLLARTKLDELPQLWNVVKGEMSLVGPRPEDPQFVAVAGDAYTSILQVKPGVTGLTQLAFAREDRRFDPVDTTGDYVRRLLPQKMALDRLYATNRSLLLDLRILAWTSLVVLLRQDVAVHRATGRLSLRRRPMPRQPAHERIDA